MGKFSLLNVTERKGDLVSGNWIQDFTGSKEEAFRYARNTERANSNRIKVAVVESVSGSAPNFSYITDVKEII